MQTLNMGDRAKQTNEEPEFIQEPKAHRSEVGEKLWGPYKAHKGTDITAKFSGGPWGLGDPEDKTLRKVEKEIMIPQIMKKKTKTDYCKEANEAFYTCAGERGFFRMVLQCRSQATALRECMAQAQADPKVIQECTDEYLAQRAEYRRTGIRKPLKRM